MTAGGAEEGSGHTRCYAGCEKRLCNSRRSPRACSPLAVGALLRMSPALLCLNSSVQAPRAAGGQRERRNTRSSPGEGWGRTTLFKAARLASACVCSLAVSFAAYKQNSFQLSYTETGTSESGLAKLMCRKALGENLKRWVEAVMHMIKVKHAAYTENC